MARIAVNGLGRMGKLLLRRLFDEKRGSELVLLNEPFGDIKQHALLLEFDTVHGRWEHGIEARDDHLSASGYAMRFTQAQEIRDLPLRGIGVCSTFQVPTRENPKHLLAGCPDSRRTYQLISPQGPATNRRGLRRSGYRTTGCDPSNLQTSGGHATVQLINTSDHDDIRTKRTITAEEMRTTAAGLREQARNRIIGPRGSFKQVEGVFQSIPGHPNEAVVTLVNEERVPVRLDFPLRRVTFPSRGSALSRVKCTGGGAACRFDPHQAARAIPRAVSGDRDGLNVARVRPWRIQGLCICGP